MSLITKSSVLVAVFLGIGVGSARAQERVVAKIPFPFVVIGQEFPAGRYTFSTDDHNVLLIRSADDRSERFAIVRAAAGRDPAGSACDRSSTAIARGPDNSQVSSLNSHCR
jgi:hypothetical protein